MPAAQPRFLTRRISCTASQDGATAQWRRSKFSPGLGALSRHELIVAARQRGFEFDVLGQAAKPNRRKNHLSVDAQLVHVAQASLDIAHFLHRDRHVFFPGALHGGRVRGKEAQLVVDHPGGVMPAEAGVFGKSHRYRS